MRRQSATTVPPFDSSDGVLARLTLSGDTRAFERLIHRYDAHLSRYVGHLLGNADQAEDALQIIWLQLYLALPELQGRTSFRSWLFLVARNLCIDELRKKEGADISLSTVEKESDEAEWVSPSYLYDPRPSPEDIAERHELQCLIRQAIDTLPPSSRPIVYLWYIERLSQDEIARRLNVSTAFVRNVLHRAKTLLRAMLAPSLALEEPVKRRSVSAARTIPRQTVSGRHQ